MLCLISGSKISEIQSCRDTFLCLVGRVEVSASRPYKFIENLRDVTGAARLVAAP